MSDSTHGILIERGLKFDHDPSLPHPLCLQIHKPGNHKRLLQLLGDPQSIHASSNAKSQPMKTAKGAVKCGIFSVVLSQFYLPKTIFRIPNNEHLGIGETRGDIFPVALELQLHC